ncbi:long-chain fatty acid--CoA ligase [Rhizobium leguminosarum]|uniref:class I adenylate-forming enzyme family protein n=1 Tax=Rhizobium leguminosarum TaxID=384 RepID=UPI001C981F86|nr:fatty acid--CoA ligase family protein [Rhizobium leguminosarum]MBY5775259.1 long-chain fatty acid--CoA ligase [Rhizobium leguminosarum]
MKLISCLLQGDRETGHLPFAVTPRETWTRADAISSVSRFVQRLINAGVKPEDRALAILPHDHHAVFLIAAASAVGLRLVMPYNLQEGALGEWLGIINTYQPQHIVCFDRCAAERLRDTGQFPLDLGDDIFDKPSSSEPILINAPDAIGGFLTLFSSGTTGRPKAISLSEDIVARKILNVADHLHFDSRTRAFFSGLINNTTGFIFAFGALANFAVLCVPETRNIARWPDLISKLKATHIMLRPVALDQFLSATVPGRTDLSSLKMVAYGAAAMPPETLRLARDILSCDFVLGYGLSETFGPFAFLDEAAHRSGLSLGAQYRVGVPDKDAKVWIDTPDVDGVGEILVDGPLLMEGYIDPVTRDVVPRQGPLRTGDLGRIEADGHLILKGRMSSSMLTPSGHRLYPEEIEALLRSIDGVEEAVLIGLPAEDRLSLQPVACIHGDLARCGTTEVRQALRLELERSLGREKWPDYIFASLTPFPKSANEKILKGEVARRASEAKLIALHTNRFRDIPLR